MAPAVVGQHWSTNCLDCGCPFRFDQSTELPANRTIVCPNCGYAKMTRGDAMAGWSRPRDRRSQSIVRSLGYCGFPHAKDTAAGIKRIVGLPGERLEIRGGELLGRWRSSTQAIVDPKKNACSGFDSRFHPGQRSCRRDGDLRNRDRVGKTRHRSWCFDLTTKRNSRVVSWIG